MGEVRVKVKLTNAFDESLARRGKISEKEVRSYEADALVELRRGFVRRSGKCHAAARRFYQ